MSWLETLGPQSLQNSGPQGEPLPIAGQLHRAGHEDKEKTDSNQKPQPLSTRWSRCPCSPTEALGRSLAHCLLGNLWKHT